MLPCIDETKGINPILLLYAYKTEYIGRRIQNCQTK